MNNKRICLKDIAQKVGVSTALVSYVLNNQKEGRINKDVAQKIRETAAKFSYRPNQIAKSLRTDKTNTIGLIVADISNPFSSSLARIIEDESFKQGYTVIFGSSDENEHKSANLIESLLNHRVDGLILFPPANAESQVLQLQQQEIPLVLVDRYFPDIDVNCVSVDNWLAASQAVHHLAAEGCNKIGMVTYNSPLFHLKERERGYLSALEELHVDHNNTWLKKVNIQNDPMEIEQSYQPTAFRRFTG
jgi:LacI family transcriptional regulator